MLIRYRRSRSIPQNNNNTTTTTNNNKTDCGRAGTAPNHYLEVRPITRLDPLDALQLGVDHQGPALAVAQDGGVLRRHAVTRQPLVVPAGDVGVIHQHGQRVQALGHRHRVLESLEEGHQVVLEQVHAVALGEGAHVGHEGGDHQHVACGADGTEGI